MMSRQEMPMPNTVTSGLVRPIIQVRPNSIATRNTKASDRPIWRTSRASFGSQREVRSEMNTRLSMPSTISSTDRVTSASQAFGSSRRSIMIAQPVGQPDPDEVERDRHQAGADPRFRREIAHQGDRSEAGP